MKKVFLFVSLFVAFSANAADALSIAKNNNCLACHAVDKKLVGPSYKDVAAKYASDKGATVELMKKVKAGTVGKWGPIPMPANPQISDADLKIVIDWILKSK